MRRRPGLLAAVAFTLVFAAPASAQAVGSISGTVIDESAAPLQGICVGTQEASTGSFGIATTGSDGTYTIPNLTPGSYRVQFNYCGGAGYVPEYYDDTTNLGAATLIAVPDGPVENVNAQLASTPSGSGSISGTVTDESDQPLAGICVGTGTSPSSFVDTTLTDASGDYSFANLPAGSYGVYFNYCGGGGYEPEYYDDVASVSQATLLQVTDGVAVQNIDAQLAAAGVPGSISGTVTDESDQPLAGICVAAQGTAGGSASTTDAGGDYTLTGVDPGDYQVVFGLAFPGCTGGYVLEYFDDAFDSNAATIVSVGDGENEVGIDAALAQAVTISGTVTDGANPVEGTCVTAHPESGPGQVFQTSTDGTGAYTIAGLAPGDYKLQFSGCFADGDPFAPEWWDNEPTRAAADVISLAAGETSSGKDAVSVRGGAD